MCDTLSLRQIRPTIVLTDKCRLSPRIQWSSQIIVAFQTTCTVNKPCVLYSLIFFLKSYMKNNAKRAKSGRKQIFPGYLSCQNTAGNAGIYRNIICPNRFNFEPNMCKFWMNRCSPKFNRSVGQIHLFELCSLYLCNCSSF